MGYYTFLFRESIEVTGVLPKHIKKRMTSSRDHTLICQVDFSTAQLI